MKFMPIILNFFHKFQTWGEEIEEKYTELPYTLNQKHSPNYKTNSLII